MFISVSKISLNYRRTSNEYLHAARSWLVAEQINFWINVTIRFRIRRDVYTDVCFLRTVSERSIQLHFAQ